MGVVPAAVFPEVVRLTGLSVGPRQVASPLVLSAALEMEMEMWRGSGLLHVAGTTATISGTAQLLDEFGATAVLS